MMAEYSRCIAGAMFAARRYCNSWQTKMIEAVLEQALKRIGPAFVT